jgi:hypothetical protein
LLLQPAAQAARRRRQRLGDVFQRGDQAQRPQHQLADLPRDAGDLAPIEL